MYSVVLVDDEPWALEGIRNIVNWNEHGFEIVGCYSTAEAAMAALSQQTVDVLFTDIRMPGKSGIDLIEWVRETNQPTECCIISSYEDFAAARLAIRYNVLEYLLKPLDRSQVRHTLEQLQEKLRIRSRSGAVTMDWDKFLQHAVRYERNYVLVQEDAVLIQPPFTASIQDVSQWQPQPTWLISTPVPLPADAFRANAKGRLGFSTVRKDFSSFVQMRTEAHFAMLLGISYSEHPTVCSVQQILVDRYETPITTAAISRMLFQTKSYICDLFKSETGETITSFLSKIRLCRAVELLNETNMSIQDIAERVGYSGADYFSKVFKRSFGYTPTQYRLTPGEQPNSEE